MNYERLARPEILAMSPYVSARSGAAADGVLLNANEAPQALLTQPDWGGLQLHRYPPPQPTALRDRLASVYETSVDRLLITRGSDEGIDLLLRVFCRPGQDAILQCPPCFGMYGVAAQVQGAGIHDVPRKADDFVIDIDAVETALNDHPDIRLVFLTSPNNPTGDLLPGGALDRVLAACGERALLVLDEAYIEFCSARSAVARLPESPQLVVLRTLSKAYAAAGLRCGAVIADPGVIALLARVMAPYPLSAPAIAAALAVTGAAARERQSSLLEQLATEKRRLLDFLHDASGVVDCWPGAANFVLLRVEDAEGLVAHCARQGVRIRDFSKQAGLGGCVRLTIGSADDMRQLRAALTEYGIHP